MLYASLFFGAILWGVGLAALRWPGWWTAVFVVFGFVSILGLPFPPVALLFLTMGLVLCLRNVFRQRPRLGLAAAVIAFVAPYAAIAYWSKGGVREMARLREKFPYESVESRLPNHPQLAPQQKLPEEAAARLDRLESGYFSGNIRSSTLRILHERQTREFVDSPGFGSMRMMRPREEYLKPRLPNEPVPQPAPVHASAGKADEEPWKARPPQNELHDLNRESVIDFANEEGFGYVKDRRHVAGFLPHRFTEVPRPRGNWSVATVELVGLLLQPEPVAYVSENLPRMEELRQAPTRKLDEFEKAGLNSLEHGEDLFTAETPSGMRMLGSIRATKQCLQCHDGERGRLLGAFSYWLREGKPKDENKNQSRQSNSSPRNAGQ